MTSKTVEKPPTRIKPKTTPKTARPPLYKVILLNDDFTPREFVVQGLGTKLTATFTKVQNAMN